MATTNLGAQGIETITSQFSDVVITEALGVIDDALATMLKRELVSSGEVADLLLDVRTLLTHPAPVDIGATALAGA